VNSPKAPNAKLVGRERELADEYLAGTSLRALAEREGVTHATVRAALARVGVATRAKGAVQGHAAGTRKALVGQEEEVLAAYRGGASLSAVARRFQSTPASVKRVLTEAGVTIRKDKGGRKRQRQLLEEAAGISPELAEGLTCTYRPPSYGPSSADASGEGRVSREPALQTPACGRPVRFAGDGDSLCEFHASARKDYALTADEIARRQRDEIEQSCAACGAGPWRTTLLRARATFEAPADAFRRWWA
jgi:transposase